MFCTEKERETCQVEKRGCEGCFYFYNENNKKGESKKMERKFDFVKRIEEVAMETTNSAYCKLPERSTAKSAGYDFYNPEEITIKSHEMKYVKTGVKANMHSNEVLLLCNRSSNPKKKGLILINGIGVIDADYYNNPDNEGEIAFAFYNITDTDVTIKQGDKLGQGIFVEYLTTVDDVAKGKRIGGFGSTGK